MDILSSVHKGEEKPTRIMYSANLSWKVAQNILGSLVDQGLLREIEVADSKRSKRRYEITEKGVNVLRYFDRARKLIDVKSLARI